MSPEIPAPAVPQLDEPCPCSSGKAYRECCGAEQPAGPSETVRGILAAGSLALLALLAWGLSPSRSQLKPAPLRPQSSPAPVVAQEVLPTSFTNLPGVDLSGLPPAERRAVLLRLNTEPCPCGCGNTLASCRVNDSTCKTSLELANKVVREVAGSRK